MKKVILGLLTLFIGTALADSAPTSVGYADSQIGTLQNKISAVDTNTVLTRTNTAGEIGQKSIYDATGNYVEQQNALVTAEVANAAVQNAIDTEFICTEWLDGAQHTNENCLIYTVHNPAPNRILPTGYTPLEYIESTGTQWIDTGITANSNIGVRTNLQYTNTDTAERIAFGAVNPNLVVWRSNNSFYFAYKPDTGYSKRLLGLGDTEKHTFEMGFNNSNLMYFDNTTYPLPNEPFSAAVSIYLFCAQYNARPRNCGAIRMYDFKITNGTSLVRNFIPARRNSDGEIGMYDTVSNTFFANAGTGEFIAGPEINGNLYLPQI